MTEGNSCPGIFQAEARVSVASADTQAQASFMVILIWEMPIGEVQSESKKSSGQNLR
jgi:hypothetical protein